MTSDTSERESSSDTFGYKTIFVEIEAQPQELTPEVLARPRYGRPDPRRYLADDAPSPNPPDAPPPAGAPNPA